MPSANVVTLLGNLTRDPNLSYTPNQTAVCDFGLAVDHHWTDQQGAAQTSVCYVNVQTWGKQAENCSKHIEKGRLVLVVGRLAFESWDQDGQPRSKHYVVAASVEWMPKGEHREPGQDG